MMFRAVFWVVLPCKMIDEHHLTRQYTPEDSYEHHINFIGNNSFVFIIGLTPSSSEVMNE
jgi:hypothetical protein